MIPGVSFYLSNFFKRRELFFRVGIYISAASLGGAFGGLLAAGLSQIPAWGVASVRIHTWRNIFFFVCSSVSFTGQRRLINMTTRKVL